MEVEEGKKEGTQRLTINSIVQVTDALGDVVKRTFPVLPGSTACLRRV